MEMRSASMSKSTSVSRVALAWALSLVLCVAPYSRLVHADDQAPPIPRTFAYTAPAEPNYVRAVLELVGVMTLGFVWYVTTTDIVHNYDLGYSWPIFRKKLLGRAFTLDTNILNTNFVGHPAGGTMYYMAARSNQLTIAESAAFAIGGSLVWEYFGEVHEVVSANDMIVTPLAGIAISEPLLQLGAFFDRSSPALRNRILGSLFAPLKTLNDALDGRTLARSEALDARGFPRNEWHQFDLRIGAAAVAQSALSESWPAYTGYELRVSLASQLARLPGYDGVAQRSIVFGDANVSAMRLDVALAPDGMVDFDLQSGFVFVGHSYRHTSRDVRGLARGYGTLLGLTISFQYTLHDYDRDHARPKDRIATVQPIGVLFEYRAALGDVRLIARASGGGDFGGVGAYAWTAFARTTDTSTYPLTLTKDRYYFAAGGHAFASLILDVSEFELAGRLRYEHYSELQLPVRVDDERLLVEVNASVGLGASAARIGLTGQYRARRGEMAATHAARSEASFALDMGARY